MSKWVTFGPWPFRNLPAKPCVYALYFDKKFVYVGQTRNLANRFFGHSMRYGYGRNIITPWGDDFHEDTKIMLKARFSERLGDWAMWEIRLIYRLQPEFNIHHKRKTT